MYFVFLESSSAVETGLDIAATTADAEFADEDAVELAVVDADAGWGIDAERLLFILTGVQS